MTPPPPPLARSTRRGERKYHILGKEIEQEGIRDGTPACLSRAHACRRCTYILGFAVFYVPCEWQ